MSVCTVDRLCLDTKLCDAKTLFGFQAMVTRIFGKFIFATTRLNLFKCFPNYDIRSSMHSAYELSLISVQARPRTCTLLYILSRRGMHLQNNANLICQIKSKNKEYPRVTFGVWPPLLLSIMLTSPCSEDPLYPTLRRSAANNWQISTSCLYFVE